MSKVVLERLGESPKTWRSIRLKEQYSHRGNCYVKHNGQIYVYKDRRVGTPVLSRVDGKWVEVGRIDLAGHVFIGGKDAMSYAEYQRTPEGRAASKKLLEQLLAPRPRKTGLSFDHGDGW